MSNDLPKAAIARQGGYCSPRRLLPAHQRNHVRDHPSVGRERERRELHALGEVPRVQREVDPGRRRIECDCRQARLTEGLDPAPRVRGATADRERVRHRIGDGANGCLGVATRDQLVDRPSSSPNPAAVTQSA